MNVGTCKEQKRKGVRGVCQPPDGGLFPNVRPDQHWAICYMLNSSKYSNLFLDSILSSTDLAKVSCQCLEVFTEIYAVRNKYSHITFPH